MNRWALLGALVFGAVFALFAFLRVDVVDARAGRALTGTLMFGLYCGIVLFGTGGESRSLSWLAQTLLGVACACAIAALLSASPAGYAVAIALGLVLGATADRWVAHLRLP